MENQKAFYGRPKGLLLKTKGSSMEILLWKTKGSFMEDGQRSSMEDQKVFNGRKQGIL